MDFSSLDLLASTALRDNNPSQTENSSTPADTQHPQHNHHDSVENDEDDDDEADGNSVKESSETASNEVGDSAVQEGEMGSVKCGKHKKNSANAKPMSIFVRDGKCVAKHLSTDVQSGSKKPVGGENVTGDGSKTGAAQKVTPPEQGGSSGPQNAAVDCAGSVSHKCPQPVEVDTQTDSQVQSSCTGITSHKCQTTASAVGDSRAENSLQRINPNAVKKVRVAWDSNVRNLRAFVEPGYDQDKQCGQSAEGDCDTPLVPVPPSPVPTAAAPTHQEDARPTSEQPEKRTEDSDCSHTDASGAGTGDSQSHVSHAVMKSDSVVKSLHQDQSNNGDKVSSDCVSCSALDGANRQQSINESDKRPSDCVNFLVPDGEKSLCLLSKNAETTETRTPKICDEDSTVVYPCPQTDVKAGGQNSSCKISLDQDKGSLGNKEPQSSSSSTKSDNVKNVLSPPPPRPPSSVTVFLALLDHTYCSRSKKFLENTDDSGDAFESADENVSADETERRPRSLSVDSMYLQYNSAGLPNQQDALSSQNDKTALLSPTLSVDSISNDSSLSEHSTTAGGQSQSYSILVGSPTNKMKGTNNTRPNLALMDSQGKSAGGTDGVCRMGSSMHEADTNSSLLDSSSLMAAGPKCGKFRIGTFGSFSNSHLELEKESKKSKLKNGLASDPVVKGSLSSPAVASPGSPFPLLQSPGMEWDRSDAGSEAPDDLDSSTTEDKFLSSSHDSEGFGTNVRQVWRHPVYHDHDYCSKEVSEEYLGKPAAPTPPVKTGKRKYVRKKDRQESEEEKLKKGKYLKRELLKQDNRFNLGAGRGAESRAASARSSLLAESLTMKPNPVGRPRKRTEKQVEEYDAETGTKMKITGKYQDQYVYYLNKSSRNRRRKVDEKLPPGDKIILPAPKPGDIVVPHLSDADCEAIRRGGRMALLNNHPQPAVNSVLPHTDSGDMDSSIVNTILSMETEHGNLHSPLTAYDGVGSTTEDFADIEGNLTSEQVKMLFDCLDDVQMEETTISQELDLFTSAESVSVPSTTVDSLAATSVEEDLMVPDVTQHSPAASSASMMGKVDSSSPVQVKLEQESLACSMTTEMQHTETKPLVGGLPVPPTSQPSVEKNLEFLKTPFFPEVSVASSGSHGLFAPAPPTSMLSPLPESKSDDVNETPWIVTVTLYFNDIPAIVINNVPHVRLVDIHRQILPAKDTGILKKRCQLMNIQVSNCSEMQRYFLVQYGRAHNSKSTLVISKDEAQRLITYYAHPPPRNLRGEEGGAGGLRRSSSYAELRSFMERPPCNPPPGRHSSLAFNQPRKRGGFRRRPMPTTRSHNASPEPMMTPSATTPAIMEPILTPAPHPPAPTSPAKGLRHKKINFREMLKGEDSSQLSPLTDGLADEDSTMVDDAPVAKGRTSKAPTTAGGGKKRRGSKEAGGAPPAKRGRKAWRKKTEGRDELPELTKTLMETGTTEDKDSTFPGTKSKKRSPGSAANGGTLTTSGRSPKSKYGLIKVNVKSLVSSGSSLSSDGTQPRKKNLFGRKSSGSTDAVVVVDETEREAVPSQASSNPRRVLRISHQDVEATTPPTPQILSPTGEVHMDLFKRASSPCVKCGTCQKFLSVADFLHHQHMDGEEMIGSTTPAADKPGHQRRILVPMNKENISLEQQRLWNEFVVLQESLDHTVGMTSMGTFPLTPLSPEASPIGSSSVNMFGGVCSPGADDSSHLMTMTPESPHPACLHNGHEDSGLDAAAVLQAGAVTVEKLVLPDSETCAASHPSGGLSLSLSAAWDTQLPIASSPSFPLLSTTHTQNEEKCVDSNLDSSDKEIQSVVPKTIASHNKKQWGFQRPRRVSPTTSIRTSSRKRETKRLYSFEKYEFGVGGKKGGRGEADTQDSEDDLPDTLLENNVSVAMNNTVFHLASATALQEQQNP